MISPKTRFVLLAGGDAASFYAALFLTLLIRYPIHFREALPEHFSAFSALLILWLGAFYVAGLYDWKNLKNAVSFFRPLLSAFAVAFLAAAAFFYLDLVPKIGVRPRGNLILFSAVFLACFGFWRYYFNRKIRSGAARSVVLIGDTPEAREIANYLREHPQFGYRTHELLGDQNNLEDKILDLYQKERQKVLVVAPSEVLHLGAARSVLQKVRSKIEARSLAAFYEDILEKTALSDMSRHYILQEEAARSKNYEFAARAADIAGSIIGIIVLAPIFALVAFAVRISSPGPIFYAQKRIGRGGEQFTLYKFRSMYADAERHGPRWAEADDPRCTPIGAWLRKSHMDELPQFFNILNSDLSFVGPRPERPEFVSELLKEIPYYDLRHAIRPGLTGWAQINYRYGASIEDARKKLQYDLYYLKRRSLAFDILIVLKTIKLFFTTP